MHHPLLLPGLDSRPACASDQCTSDTCRPNFRSKILLCGQEIEIDDDIQEYERLPTNIVKMKWRNDQILAQHRDYQKDKKCNIQKPSFDGFTHRDLASLSYSAMGSRDAKIINDETPVSTRLSSRCAHSVWSGWVMLNDSGTFLCRPWKGWKEWWCVLKIECAQLRLDCIDVRSPSNSASAARSITLDPFQAVTMDAPILSCTACVQLSIREQGSGRRHGLKCESPQEAKRLLACVNTMLRSLRGIEPSQSIE